jgi:HK97 family phage major capsid protein
MFTESSAYKEAIEARKATGSIPEGFSTPPVSLSAKGTLLEGSGSPGSGSGGGLLAVPQVVPGVVDTLFQPLTIADVLGSGQSNGNSIRYVTEGTATSGAAGVAEGGLKPESTLGLGTRDEPIKKIATLLPISEEMLEDAPQVESYINGRLRCSCVSRRSASSSAARRAATRCRAC